MASSHFRLRRKGKAMWSQVIGFGINQLITYLVRLTQKWLYIRKWGRE
jgi:hypothetical protein